MLLDTASRYNTNTARYCPLSRGRGATASDRDGEMHLKITLEFVVVNTIVDLLLERVIRMQDAVSGVPECICQVIQKMGLWNFGTSQQRRDTCSFIFYCRGVSFKNCQRIGRFV